MSPVPNEWTSVFGPGLGLDSDSNMPDCSIAHYANSSVANSIKASLLQLEKLLGNMWFEWDPTAPLASQFETTAVKGSDVASASLSQVTYCGVDWLSASVTSDGSAGNSAKTTAMFPVLATPPTNNNLLVCQWVSHTQAGGYYCGAQISSRFTSSSDGYVARVAWSGSQILWSMNRLSGSYGSEVTTLLGDEMSDPPQVAQYDGIYGMGLATEGDTIVTLCQGERQSSCDPSSGVTVSGVPAIGGTVGNINSDTTVNYYRSIRCFSITENGFLPVF